MSASERADPWLYELFKHSVVQCHHAYARGASRIGSDPVGQAHRRTADEGRILTGASHGGAAARKGGLLTDRALGPAGPAQAAGYTAQARPSVY